MILRTQRYDSRKIHVYFCATRLSPHPHPHTRALRMRLYSLPRLHVCVPPTLTPRLRILPSSFFYYLSAVDVWWMPLPIVILLAWVWALFAPSCDQKRMHARLHFSLSKIHQPTAEWHGSHPVSLCRLFVRYVSIYANASVLDRFSCVSNFRRFLPLLPVPNITLCKIVKEFVGGI